MQNAITILLFALFFLLLSILPAWDQEFTLNHPAGERAPVVIVPGA